MLEHQENGESENEKAKDEVALMNNQVGLLIERALESIFKGLVNG